MMRYAVGCVGALVLLALAACGGERELEFHEVVTVAEAGASNPTVAVSPDGVFYVAWVGVRERAGAGVTVSDAPTQAGFDVWLARSEDGVVFSEPVRVNDIAGDAAPHEQAPAQVAAGADGLVVVVWQNNRHEEGRRFPYSDLRLARSVDAGRSFAPAVTVNDDAGGPPSSHTFHDVAIGPANEVVVSWIDSRERTRLEREMAATGAHGSGTDMHGGHAEAALPGPEIRVARSADGGVTFVPSLVVAAEACPCCRTSLEIDADGELAVAWRGAEPGNVRDIMVARTADGAFGEPAIVHGDGWRIDGCPHAGPAIAIDGEGRLHAAWYTGAEGREGLYYAEASDNRAFTEPVPLIAGGGFVPVSQVKMAAMPAGGVLVAWENRAARSIAVGVADGSGVRRLGGGMPGASPAVAGGGVAWLDGEAVRFVAVR